MRAFQKGFHLSSQDEYVRRDRLLSVGGVPDAYVRLTPSLHGREYADFTSRHVAGITSRSNGEKGAEAGGLKPCCSGRKHKNVCCKHPRDLAFVRKCSLRHVAGITSRSSGEKGAEAGGLKPCYSGRKHKNVCCKHPRDLAFARKCPLFPIAPTTLNLRPL